MYRMFFAFLLLIIIPFTFLQIYNFNKVQTLIVDRIHTQNQAQVEILRTNLESVRFAMLQRYLEMEKDFELTALLEASNIEFAQSQTENIRERLKVSIDKLSPQNEYISYTLQDLSGHTYKYPEMDTQYDQKIDVAFANLEQTHQQSDWIIEETAGRGSTLSLYAILQTGSGHSYAKLRITFYMNNWLLRSVNDLLIQGDYAILDATGRMIAQTRPSMLIPRDVQNDIMTSTTLSHTTSDLNIVNASILPSLHWTMISIVSLETYIGDMNAVKRSVFATSGIFVLLFILTTFVVVSGLTRPLRHLQFKMSQIVRENFNSMLPEHKYVGESLVLAQTYNNMLKDIRSLIQRLKVEERQKEALRFQMLTTQMNPHFLLNTLNLIKFQAMDNHQVEIMEICMSLGRLLEQSLSADSELIFLKDELVLIQAYLFIQKVRYEDSFSIQLEVQSGLDYVLIPQFALQPLIENSIMHGMMHRSGGGVIRISICSRGNDLVVEVEDNGRSHDVSKEQIERKRKGIGIYNLQERLTLLFRDEGRLEMIPLQPGMLVRLQFPLLISNPYQGEDKA